MFLNLLLDHDDDLEEEDWRQWQLHWRDSRECPEKVFSFHMDFFSGKTDNIQFATIPLKFFAADAKTFFQGKSIYVLKRFATPDLLVLSSSVVCDPSLAIEDGQGVYHPWG